MRTERSIVAAILLPGSLLFLPAAQAADSNPFHFWFQRDGACVACAQMPPPGKAEFSEQAGIDVMFNGYNQTKGEHWQNQNVESYKVVYTYKLEGVTHSATQTASGDAASLAIKPYPAGDGNSAQVVGISVTATYATGPGTKTVTAPKPFQVY